MRLDTAPTADRRGNSDDEDDENATCERDECDGTYVLYDHDRVCRRCGHISGTGNSQEPQSYREACRTDAWVAFERERQSEEYSGFYGPKRVKMVGGFLAPWDFEKDLPN